MVTVGENNMTRTIFHHRRLLTTRTTALIRLTEAQDPFFAALDERMPQYRAIATPALIIAGDGDRVMAPKVQKKIAAILSNCRFELIEDSGHVVHLEQTDRFFELVLALMRTRHTSQRFVTFRCGQGGLVEARGRSGAEDRTRSQPHSCRLVIPSVARNRCGRAARSSSRPPTPLPRYARDDMIS